MTEPDALPPRPANVRRASLLLAAGTTLTVYPVAQMVPIAARRGAPIVIVNGQETAMDEFGEAVVTGSISEVLPPIVGWVGD